MRCVLLDRALYLDGNNLECEGATHLIQPFVEQALLDAHKHAAAAAAAVEQNQGEGRGQGQDVPSTFTDMNEFVT